MNENNNSNLGYYLNFIARKIQNAFITTPELGFVGAIVIGIIVLLVIARLFILPR